MSITMEQALQNVADDLAAINEVTSKLTPREAAERAWHVGGPSVDEIEQDIVAARARRASRKVAA